MRTVKQVSDLTKISVRMLHHYDKIGLLKPTKLTQAGYRLYDDEALETLQQILCFLELSSYLNEIKDIITNPHFDKMKALENHKKLIILKRDRLNGLIELINNTLKGANTMSFNEFDMTEYYNVLEEFKKENTEKVIKMWGSIDKYDEIISKVKSEEEKFATMAIKQYGSIEKYAKALKENLNNSLMLTKAEEMDRFKEDCICDNNPKLKELYKELTADLSKDISSKEIQQVATDITNMAKDNYEIFRGDMGDSYWHSMVQLYLVFPDWIKKVDNIYGSGASKFIGKALKYNLDDYEPKLETLYKKLTSDLSKSPSCEEIQEIIVEIVDETQKQHDCLKIEIGENYWTYQSEQYCLDSNIIKLMDNKYRSGSSKFIGEALKFYIKSND
ncbi:MerR family transcriptional regulator [Terrisporobacter sp.]|uniref:MerR family transcriptional regulator n=1 Tax=Terrisporobacter sp. TaxID=1965305 RepID=UPI00289F3C1F|nr:MerR family transcriptional regulator [Terrisporobacter sp.]